MLGTMSALPAKWNIQSNLYFLKIFSVLLKLEISTL